MAKRPREPSISLSPMASDDGDASSPATAASSAPLCAIGGEAHTPKYIHLDAIPSSSIQPKAMTCHLPPHPPLIFPNYSAYEVHYHSSHTNRCTTCRANFPSPHFLALHITEHHDPLAASRRARGEKGFACFVEGCDKTCSQWKKRRSHLVDRHGFPRNYDFFIVDTGVDGRRSMLRAGVDARGHRKSSREGRRRSGTETAENTPPTDLRGASVGDEEAEETLTWTPAVLTPASEVDLEQLTASMSSLKMVPRSVTFGKRKGKAGFAKS